MKILLLALNRLADDSMNVCRRNILTLANYINDQTDHDCQYLSIISNADMDSQKKFVHLKNEQFDRIIAVYSSFYFHKDGLNHLVLNQKNCKYGWLSTEYDLSFPLTTEVKKFDFIITNYVESVYNATARSKYDKYHMANVNTFVAQAPRWPMPYKDLGACYYGRYREDRGEYFKKYFTDAASLSVSTSKKNVKRFKQLGCTTKRYYDAFDWTPWRETLRKFKYSLYLEDKYTHVHYNHLGNRFYEAIACGAVPLFDKSCLGTIKLSGAYVPDEYIIDSVSDLNRRVVDYDAGLAQKFFDANTEIALDQKQKTLRDIVTFLEGL